MNTTPTPATDYGEPWKVGSIHKPLLDCYGHDPLLLHRTTQRAASCVNACAGVADPAAEMQAMREAIKEAHDALANVSTTFGRTPAQDAALTKLQTFLKP